jgi:hypothetical protein
MHAEGCACDECMIAFAKLAMPEWWSQTVQKVAEALEMDDPNP